MPQISGVASSTQVQEQPIDLSGLAQTIMQLKAQKKQQAVQNLQMTLDLAQKGLVDATALEKSVKEWEKVSGIKLADAKPEQGGGGEAPINAEQGKAIQAVGKAGQQPSGAQSASPVDPSSAKKYPAGGMQPPLEGGNMYENYVNQVRRLGKAKGLQEEQTANMEATLAQLKDAGMRGDEGARGQLQAMGVLSFNAEFERIRQMKKEDPIAYAKETAAAHDRALGLEEPAAKETRKSNFVVNLVQQGYTPEQAAKEFDVPGSSGIKKTLQQQTEEVKKFRELQVAFGDEVAAKIAPQLSAGASLSDVLPTVGKYQSQFAQQMSESKAQHEEEMKLRREESASQEKYQNKSLAMQQQGVDLQKERLAFDKEMGDEKFANLAERVNLEMMKAENADFSARMSDLIAASKVMHIPDEVIAEYTSQLAKKVGLTENEAKGWYNWMTPKYIPDVSRADELLDKFAPKGGRAKKPPARGEEPGVLDILGKMPQENAAVGAGTRIVKKGASAVSKGASTLVSPLSNFLQTLGTSDVKKEGQK